MTHQEHIDKWNNKPQERQDPSNRNQCFDSVIGYCIDVYGLPEDTFSGLLHAYQIYTQPTEKTGTKFDFIVNTPWAVAKQGDILVWNQKYGTSGHTAIVHSADINNIVAFSQNDPVGKPCHLKTYTYMNILGWLRLIKPNTNNAELEKKIESLTNSERILKQQLQDKDKQIKETSDNAARQLEQQAKTAQTMIDQTKKDCNNKINGLTNDILFLVEKYRQ